MDSDLKYEKCYVQAHKGKKRVYIWLMRSKYDLLFQTWIKIFFSIRDVVIIVIYRCIPYNTEKLTVTIIFTNCRKVSKLWNAHFIQNQKNQKEKLMGKSTLKTTSLEIYPTLILFCVSDCLKNRKIVNLVWDYKNSKMHHMVDIKQH